MRLLVLGGYGVFGGRLIELLADLDRLEILVCGRSQSKADAFVERTQSASKLIPIALDRANIGNALTKHKPDIVIDASGPFQHYGDNPYAVIQACLDRKVHYLDFADAADFVFGISKFDEAAQQADICILSGVSSFPVLTAAVIQELGQDMEITSVTGGIAPSPYAGIGLNVMRAVVSYAGGPVKLVRDGRPHVAKGLTESRRYTIAPPGYLPLNNIHFSLVDVPDLQLLPKQVPTINDIWVGAGPVPESLHKILNLLARLRALLNLPSFASWSPLFYRVLNLMKFGENRGGMFVEVEGIEAQRSTRKSWHLLAEGDDGPYIPSMAVEAIVRKWLAGEIPAPGARAATGALKLSDYRELFDKRDIYCGVREEQSDNMSLFERILESAYSDLPVQLQIFHNMKASRHWKGEASIEGPRNPLTKIVALIFGFPRQSSKVPVEVTVSPESGRERWTRNFGGKIFHSFLQPGKAKNTHLVTEKFGLVTFGMALVWKDGKLYFIPRRWSIFGIGLPQILIPNGESYECQKDGRFHFNVTIALPLFGKVTSYRGWLEPA